MLCSQLVIMINFTSHTLRRPEELTEMPESALVMLAKYVFHLKCLTNEYKYKTLCKATACSSVRLHREDYPREEWGCLQVNLL